MESEAPFFSLERETATDKSTGLRQPELLNEWSEFYPEEIDPQPPTKKPKTRPWWQRGSYE
jgi:hypothetical protein